MNTFMKYTVLAAVALLAGCSAVNLPTGKYDGSLTGREDFAVVFEDLIFIHVKSPEDAPGKLMYWDWAGKYEVDSDGEIELDMDKLTKKRWKFYYNFLKHRDGISVNDLSNNTGFRLRYISPSLRSGSGGPRPVGSAGVNPLYKDIEAQ